MARIPTEKMDERFDDAKQIGAEIKRVFGETFGPFTGWELEQDGDATGNLGVGRGVNFEQRYLEHERQLIDAIRFKSDGRLKK